MEFQKYVIDLLGIEGLIVLLVFTIITSIVTLTLKQKINNFFKFFLIIIIVISLLILVYFISTKNNTSTSSSSPQRQYDRFFVTNIDTNLSLRAEPSKKARELLLLFPEDKDIKILDIIKNKNNNIWYQINFDGHRGWVFGKYIKNDYGKYYVKTKHNNTLTVREEAFIKAKEKGELLANEKYINILKKKRNQQNEMWFYIHHCDKDGQEIDGWISAKYLKKEEL